MTKTLKHQEFKATLIKDEDGPYVMLEQVDGWGNDGDQAVVVHPHQLREVCEQFGIVAADPQAAKTVATLNRRILALRDRINDLRNHMTARGDRQEDRRAIELASIIALADLANEWGMDACADDEAAKAVVGLASDAYAGQNMSLEDAYDGHPLHPNHQQMELVGLSHKVSKGR